MTAMTAMTAVQAAVERVIYDPGARMNPHPPLPTLKEHKAAKAGKAPKKESKAVRGAVRGAAPNLGTARRAVVETRALLDAEQLQAALVTAAESGDDVAWLVAHASSLPLLSRDEEVALARTMRQGAPSAASAASAARERFITHNLRLVIRMARSMAGMGSSGGGNGGLDLSDLIQEGMIGLVRAVDRYDPESGNRFSTYATWWIAQAIHHAAADTGHAVRLPVYLFERRRRLMRLRGQLSAQLAHEPTFAEIAAAYTAAYGSERWNGGRTKNTVMMTPEDVAELLAIQGPVLSLEHQMAGHATRGGASADDDVTLGGMLADPTTEEEFAAREQDEDARWLLDIAKYALGVRGDPHEQMLRAQREAVETRAQLQTAKLAYNAYNAQPTPAASRQAQRRRRLLDAEIRRLSLTLRRAQLDEVAAREYDIFVTRALTPGASLEVIGARYGITRERVRQIETHANECVRRALAEVGVQAPKPLDAYPHSQEEQRRLWRERDMRRRETRESGVVVAVAGVAAGAMEAQ